MLQLDRVFLKKRIFLTCFYIFLYPFDLSTDKERWSAKKNEAVV